MKAAVTATLCVAFAAAHTAHADNLGAPANAGQEAKKLTGANISLPAAIRTAEQNGDGLAISATYDPMHGNEGRYKVIVMSPDGRRLTQFDLDAYDGEVNEAWNHPFSMLHPDLSPPSVRDAATSLAGAIVTAEERAGGKATAATVEHAGGQVLYTVDVARTDGSARKVEIDASAGKLASSPRAG